MHVLLVEDDPMIAAAIKVALLDSGYCVDHVDNGDAADRALRGGVYQIVLLDVILPRCDGLSLLRLLRLRHDWVPVILITACNARAERIAGLDIGADDYLAKPFDIDELLARMRAVLRRHTGEIKAELGNGDVTLDPTSRMAWRGERCELLTASEAALMHALLSRPGTVLGRRELERRLYGTYKNVDRNAIGFLIHGVRRKLGADLIRNVRGAGWMVEKHE